MLRFLREESSCIENCFSLFIFIFSPRLLFRSLLLMLLPSSLALAESPDTTRVYTIDEVTITSRQSKTGTRTSAPLNLLSDQQIKQMNALQVSDLLKFFPGVNVKDYGGIGGLKTVSVRSLGATHTAVSYDGISLSDVQTGQIDISRFSLDNIEMIALYNGQGDNIFQPARLFASASLLNIKTKSPQFSTSTNSHGNLFYKTGSFGLINPGFQFHQRLNSKLFLSLSGEWLQANGEYNYKLEHSFMSGAMETTEKRSNTDVQSLRLETAINAKITNRSSAIVKTYFFLSERGLPGATILYNTDNFSSQRITDQTFFTQANFNSQLTDEWSILLNGKFNRGILNYVDTTYLNIAGKMESVYLQQEWYGSFATLYQPSSDWSLSFASDGFINQMHAQFETEAITEAFPNPVRYSLLSVIAAKYETDKLLSTASLLSTSVRESVANSNPSLNHQKWSPYWSISYKPFADYNLRFRGFYKHIFRLPTFNDLYYARVGNVGLKPETTHQYNIGLTYLAQLNDWLPGISITADAYRNKVFDKIVAMPNKNIFIWSMVNLGEIEITGLDLTAQSHLEINKDLRFVLTGSYTYQRALDVTDVDGGSYGHQIPYTPRISGSARLVMESRYLHLAYELIWSGKRYAGYQNFAENRLPGYADHSISALRYLDIYGGKLMLKAEVLNLLDNQYEIVRWFPMPGRSFRASISINY